ncbi:MAG: hypothetical protein KDE27_28005 [Planctomycetes bacterium]|nr:hypothetical protein [Planctomycetota bacterium]
MKRSTAVVSLLLLPLALFGLALTTGCSSSPEPASIPHFASPMAGVYSSGQPSPEQFAALPSIGIKRVINLRAPGESGTGWEEQRARELGIEFVRLPIAGKDGLSRANVERFAAELAQPSEAGVLVSCGSSNRVGAMFALKAAWLDGASKETALSIGRKAGLTKLEPAVAELLDQKR